MINSIAGTVKDITDNVLTIDTGFLGFGVQVPQVSVFSIGQKVELLTYMHWNQENGPSLFGFQHQLEKTVFLLVIACPGVGPKLGMAILAQMAPQEFLQAIQAGNEAALSSVSGIGAKKAEQIMVQLKHKVAKLLETTSIQGATLVGDRQNILQVLKSLNYSRTEIAAAMQHLNDNYPGNSVAFDQLMRQALAFLAKRI